MISTSLRGTRWARGLLLLSVAIVATPVRAGDVLPKSDIPIERFYQYPLISGRSPSNPAMSPDGSKIAFGWNQTGARKLDLWVMEFPGGKKQRIVAADAIADFGSYGAAFARWILGMPETVYCVRGNYTKDYEVSDDHAVLVLKYPKCSAVLEGTWATKGWDSSANPVIHGKEGTLSVLNGQIHKSGETVDLPEAASKGPAEYFYACIREGKQPEGILNPEIAADACRILDAAIKSSASGCAERP